MDSNPSKSMNEDKTSYQPFISIIIPTYNHCDDLLRPCIESIIKYTDLNPHLIELIIAANGCTDNTKAYLDQLMSEYDAVNYIWSDEPMGYTSATNKGIRFALGKYIVLMNNDVVLLEQEKNKWLNLLSDPFADSSIGITGPVKFDWDCAGVTLQAMAFWLVMIPVKVFNEIGVLDEIFSPGMGEDGDFCARLVKAGYKMISVPDNVAGHFDTGIINNSFPIYHVGNGTFNDNVPEKEAVIERNNKILYDRYGLKNLKAAYHKQHGSEGFKKKDWVEVSIIVPTYNHLETALKPCLKAILDYTDFSNKELIIVCNGCTDGTREYLNEFILTNRFYIRTDIFYIWTDEPTGVVRAYNDGIVNASGKYIVTIDNDSHLMPQPTDAWIDVLMAPFLADPMVGASSPFAADYEGLGLVLHSGCTMYRSDILKQLNGFDERYNPGYFCDPDMSLRITEAGYKCVEVPKRDPDKKYENGVFTINFPVMHLGHEQTMDKRKDHEIVKRNREMLYEQHSSLINNLQSTNTKESSIVTENKNTIKYSIVIPTYNHCNDLLRPCIESIHQFTDMHNVEIIVVANGCMDNTREYLNSDRTIKYIWTDEAVGYTRATNLGIKEAKGEFVILLNNDTVLLGQNVNTWVEMLEAPFIADHKVGITGPLQLFDNYSNHYVLIFFCVMIRRSVFDEIGLLDEIYSPGGGEDIDFTIRIKNAGYKAVEVTPKKYTPSAGTNVGGFPIWHKDNQTFKNIPEYTNHIIKRNGFLNCLRYNKEIRLNIGAGGIDYPGFLSLDKYDKRANIPMDITKLTDFGDNTVTEIMASHVFEHLSPYDSIPILKEWLRVMKPGAKIAMEMPDILELCKQFVANNGVNIGRQYGLLNAIYGSVNTTDVGDKSEITSPHLFGWWPESLYYHMTEAGYTDITFGPEQWPHPEFNFRVEAYKPANKIDHSFLKKHEPITYKEIFDDNSYGLETAEVRGRTVIDIGANVGLFSLACVERGATRVIAVEAQKTVFNLGLINYVKDYSQIEPLNYAVHRNNGNTVYLENNHVGSKIGTTGEPVTTITLETLLEQNNVLGKDLVLKLDCEGAEFDVILNSPVEVLRKFSVIYMELHNDVNPKPEYQNAALLEDKLKFYGFRRVSRTLTENPKVSVQKWLREE